MNYVFSRPEGFYLIELGSDLEAIANAFHNFGTLKVSDGFGRIVFDIDAVAPLSQFHVDQYLDLILRASGSRMENYSMERTKLDMRRAMRTVLYAAQIGKTNQPGEAG